ncbi:hypothetical protein [Halorussus aquaticus]|uniref:Late embryogenesis abundant protein LEA-2 subgroup domain-containing protein n=1 Tax=Halorussus aquaticus TaxID=2953748 RepID=A0ABD5PY83_9EURY|nr:hypothetical protein [Halorussus aquaticus]
MTGRIPFGGQRPTAVGSFLLVALVATMLFVPTFSAHVAVMNKVSIDATATEVATSDDGSQLVVEIRVRNPTRSAFTASYGRLYGKVGNRTLTTPGVELDGGAIGAGETGTVTARIEIADGSREEAAAAVESERLRVVGQLEGTIQDVNVRIDVTEGEVDG